MNKLSKVRFPFDCILFGLLHLSGIVSVSCFAQESAEPRSVFTPNSSDIVAVVDGFEIRAGYVLKSLQVANPDTKGILATNIDPRVWAGAVEHLIQRQSVLKGLRDDPAGIGTSELKLEIGRIEKQLKSVDTSLAGHIERIGLTQPEFENELRWRLTWTRYLDRMLSEENVNRYFEQHRRDFDGTQLLVDQILWMIDADAPNEYKTAKREQAAKVSERLKSGELSWKNAVREFSMSPLAVDPSQSGRLIGRNAPMPPEFSAAAFALEKDGISPPTESAIGIHIIRCLEIRPGKRLLDEVSDSVRAEMTEKLFQHLVSKNRPGMDVEHRPGFPHIDATGQFVEQK